jgi:hypothetical protein
MADEVTVSVSRSMGVVRYVARIGKFENLKGRNLIKMVG